MAFGITEQGYIVTFLDHGIPIRTGRHNAIASQAFYIAAGVGINTGFAQRASANPLRQFGSDPIGANDRQIGLAAILIGKTSLAGNLMGLFTQVEFEQSREIAHHQHQPEQTNHIGEGITDTHVVQKLTDAGIVRNTQIATLQTVLRADQRWSGGERTG